MDARIYFLENYMGNANLSDSIVNKFNNASQAVCKNVLTVNDSTRLRIPRDAYIDVVIGEAEFNVPA